MNTQTYPMANPWRVAASQIHGDLSKLKGNWIHHENSFLPANVECDYDGHSKFRQLLENRIQAACEAYAETIDSRNSQLLIGALKGCHDMLRECAKQFRCIGDAGHSTVADLHADQAANVISQTQGEKSLASQCETLASQVKRLSALVLSADEILSARERQNEVLNSHERAWSIAARAAIALAQPLTP